MISIPASASERALARLRVRVREYRSTKPETYLLQVDSFEEAGRFFLSACFSNEEFVTEDYEPELGTRLPLVLVVAQRMEVA